MQYYQTDNNKQGKTFAWLFTGLYVVLWVLLIIFISFEPQKTEDSGGILIDFGDSELASGQHDLAHIEPTEAATVQPKVEAVEQLQTQEFEPAPEVEAVQKLEPEVEVEKPREVNKKALFRGSTSQSQSKSEGDNQNQGNQGNEKGAQGGEKTGTGQSTSGSSYDLRGRNLIGELPRPDYGADELGQIIIRVVVSPRGDVTSATFEPQGSTTQNPALVQAAEAAAKKAKFNITEGLTPQQGTITYIFKQD